MESLPDEPLIAIFGNLGFVRLYDGTIHISLINGTCTGASATMGRKMTNGPTSYKKAARKNKADRLMPFGRKSVLPKRRMPHVNVNE